MQNEMVRLSWIGLVLGALSACGLDESDKTSCVTQGDCLNGYRCVSEVCLEEPRGKTGQPLSASGSFSTAIVVAHAGALEIVLGEAQDACASRYSRMDFFRAPGLRIAVIAADRGGTLEFSPPAAEYVTYGPGPVPAANQFAAVLRQEIDGEIVESDATDGVLSLDARPEYDSGALFGQYQLAAGGKLVFGAFRAAYCPTEEGVDAAQIAMDLYDYCSLTPELALEPGSTLSGDASTAYRDLTRGMLSAGLSREAAACLNDKIDRCKSGQTGTTEQERTCFYEEISRCLDPYVPISAACGA